MRLLAVILHYGDPAPGGELLRVLREADPARATDVRVLDNAAPLPFAHAWRREPENRFWAGALETCIALAGAEGFSHLWFLNNDIRFLDPPSLTAVEARIARLERVLQAQVGLWSPAVAVNPYHPQMCPVRQIPQIPQIPQIRAESVPGTDAPPSHAQPGGRPTARRVRLLDCVAPVLNLEAVAGVGGLDAAENPRGYGVDLWLSLRMAAAGWEVLVDQTLVIRHKAHGTARAIPGFLPRAALDEDQFCAARLGPHWRERLQAMKLEDAHPSHLISL